MSCDLSAVIFCRQMWLDISNNRSCSVSSRPYERPRWCYGQGCVRLPSVMYVLWLNGASYRKTVWRGK